MCQQVKARRCFTSELFCIMIEKLDINKTLSFFGDTNMYGKMTVLASQRWLPVMVLIAFLSGCSSFRAPMQFEGGAIPEKELGELHVLAVDDEVVVVLLDGTEAKGIVVEIAPSSLVVVGVIAAAIGMVVWFAESLSHMN